MDQKAVVGKFMRFLGKYYEFLYRLPLVGEPLVRGINRTFGRINFYSPGSGFQRFNSITELKDNLFKMGDKMGYTKEEINLILV